MASPRRTMRCRRPKTASRSKPFSDFDYGEGFKAGANDKRWADHYAARGIA
jgi:hypothetical protein